MKETCLCADTFTSTLFTQHNNEGQSDMGNRASRSGNSSNDLEYNCGKRLILSIKLNVKEQTQEAIEIARKECVKPTNMLTASVYSYDDMVLKVHEYLTKTYSIQVHENEVSQSLTPLAYANLIDSKDSAQVITNTIADLTKSINTKDTPSNRLTVTQTKETLKNRQTEYAYTSQGVQPPPKQTSAAETVSVRQMMKESANPNDRALEAKMKLKAFQATRKKK